MQRIGLAEATCSSAREKGDNREQRNLGLFFGGPHCCVEQSHNSSTEDDLTGTKRDLLRAEVRLAKACVTPVMAEIDVKVLNARLKALVKYRMAILSRLQGRVALFM